MSTPASFQSLGILAQLPNRLDIRILFICPLSEAIVFSLERVLDHFKQLRLVIFGTADKGNQLMLKDGPCVSIYAYLLSLLIL